MDDDLPRSEIVSPSEHRSSRTGRTAESGKALTVASSMSRSSIKSTRSFSDYQANPGLNPFKMPPDNDIFLIREIEQQRKLKEKLARKKMKVHEKMTYAVRVNAKPKAVIKSPEPTEEKNICGFLDDKDDQDFTLAVTRDRRLEKESLAEYIGKKREMFLVQYSLGVKRDEMRKLEEIALAEERKLELAEQYLEEDAAMFDEFLKENDKSSGDAIKIAEAETKAKLEKVSEIRHLNAQTMSVKSEISKYEDQLKEYQMYRQFLESLSPKDWLEEKKQEQLIQQKNRQSSSQSISGDESQSSVLKPDGSSFCVIDGEENAELPELYFTNPMQLLDIFAELEEQNLSLIQNSQETEEALEEMKQNVKNTKLKMEKETDILKEQIEKLNSAIAKEEEKAKDLEIKARMFSFGEFKSEDQEQMLVELNKKVEEVYRNCVGDNEASISTLQMLTNIENRLEELFQQIEMMPHDKVEAAEKIKEKERRLKQREEKLELARLHQEERVRKALERANAEPKKKTGRRLVMRSEPPQVKKTDEIDADIASREEEELAYYFMP